MNLLASMFCIVISNTEVPMNTYYPCSVYGPAKPMYYDFAYFEEDFGSYVETDFPNTGTFYIP